MYRTSALLLRLTERPRCALMRRQQAGKLRRGKRTVSRPTETVPTNLRAETFFDAMGDSDAECIVRQSGMGGRDGGSSTAEVVSSGCELGESGRHGFDENPSMTRFRHGTPDAESASNSPTAYWCLATLLRWRCGVPVGAGWRAGRRERQDD